MSEILDIASNSPAVASNSPAVVSDSPASKKTYQVKVGIAECMVKCGSEGEAIRLAREHLNRELPHMSAVIRGILDKEFRVDQVGR